MRKTDITSTIAKTAELTEREADNALCAFVEQVTNALARGEAISLIGFGSFSVRNRAARTGRHPKTGEAIQIAASNQVSFKPGKQLKELVNC